MGWKDRANSTEHRAWSSMIGRCCNPKHKCYPDYGARGIVVCDRWRHSFSNFLADMGFKPHPDLQLERRDNDGPYSPKNCIWATRKVQARNRRNTRLYEVDGREATIAEWSELYGVGYQTIRKRLDAGWSPSDAVKQPPMSRREASLLSHQKLRAA